MRHARRRVVRAGRGEVGADERRRDSSVEPAGSAGATKSSSGGAAAAEIRIRTTAGYRGVGASEPTVPAEFVVGEAAAGAVRTAGRVWGFDEARFARLVCRDICHQMLPSFVLRLANSWT